MNQIKDIFAIILDFREATVRLTPPYTALILTYTNQDNLYNYCLTESARRDTELDVQRVSPFGGRVLILFLTMQFRVSTFPLAHALNLRPNGWHS